MACLYDCCKSASVYAWELWAVFRHTIPNALDFNCRWYVSGGLSSESVSGGTLYKFETEKTAKQGAVLLLHGDYGYASNLQHLADAFPDKHVYALQINDIHNLDCAEKHLDTIEATLAKINQAVGNTGVFGVGHSKGGIYLSYLEFVRNNTNLSGVATIGSRMKVDKHCKEKLKPYVSKIFQEMPHHLDRRVLQVAGIDEWAGPLSVFHTRVGSGVTVPASHLGSLFTEETVKAVTGFVKSS